TPFVRFGYDAANAAIGAATEDERAVHIVDFGIGLGTQWPVLLERLAARPDPPRIRLTGIDLPVLGPAPAAPMREAGMRLQELARAAGLDLTLRGLVGRTG